MISLEAPSACRWAKASIVVLLSLALSAGLTGCGSNPANDNDNLRGGEKTCDGWKGKEDVKTFCPAEKPVMTSDKSKKFGTKEAAQKGCCEAPSSEEKTCDGWRGQDDVKTFCGAENVDMIGGKNTKFATKEEAKKYCCITQSSGVVTKEEFQNHRKWLRAKVDGDSEKTNLQNIIEDREEWKTLFTTSSKKKGAFLDKLEIPATNKLAAIAKTWDAYTIDLGGPRSPKRPALETSLKNYYGESGAVTVADLDNEILLFNQAIGNQTTDQISTYFMVVFDQETKAKRQVIFRHPHWTYMNAITLGLGSKKQSLSGALKFMELMKMAATKYVEKAEEKYKETPNEFSVEKDEDGKVKFGVEVMAVPDGQSTATGDAPDGYFRLHMDGSGMSLDDLIAVLKAEEEEEKTNQ